jgi:hypothetical protein
MRGSLQKLLEGIIKSTIFYLHKISLVCEMKNPTMNQYLNAFDNCSWLQHVKAVLDAAIFIARVRLTCQ